MKYLITGGCGFLGSNLAQEVLKRKSELFIFDNLSRVGSEKNLEFLKSQGDFKFIHGDIRNSNDVELAIINVKPDVLFHLAGQVAMTTSIKNPKLDFEINVIGTINVLEAVRKHSPESVIVYSSTNKVYGDLEYLEYHESQSRYSVEKYPMGFDEKMNLEFHSPYGCSKGAADQYLLDYHRIYGLKTIVFRHSSMYGINQYSTYDQGWIGWFCQKALETKLGKIETPFTISGNGKQVRDVLFADDVVNCYFLAIENINATKGQAFNIGGGSENSLSLLELFSILQSNLQIKLDYIVTPWRESDQKVFIADNSKIMDYTGWKPKVSKNEGVSKMLEWLKLQL
jgi:CDP-paratose 2-epimerase